ncbi:WD40 repeat-like protein [Nadsonia fulvescens var. elongata DSM 6958]|uniref:WD40 repeat-like protein n=1 Tax=Nadsonia fulvescens var. elongata DSM 6958 TaxID=857566 RepID=A0A1E3PF64_9ASCO|nr:WD40 repeat-like protein [Nadsonia fulvescens var. elongata DSM 6958]
MFDYTEWPSKRISDFKAHEGPINALRYNSTGQYLLTGGNDRIVKLWNSSTQTNIMCYKFHAYEILDLAIIADNSKFASCGGDRTILYWDVSTGKVISKFGNSSGGHSSSVSSISFNDEPEDIAGNLLVSGSYDTTVKFWDCRSSSNRCIQTITDSKDSVSQVEFKGSSVLVGSVDGNVRIYDIRNGQVITNYIGHAVTSVSYMNEPKRAGCFLSSSHDSIIRLIDVETGSLRQAFRGHRNANYRIFSSFAQNNTKIVSGSEDGFIYVWNVLNGELLNRISTLPLIRGDSLRDWGSKMLSTVVVHPGSQQMVNGSTDGKLIFYGL